MKNRILYISVFLFSNLFFIYYSYKLGAENQWLLDAPGRILIYDKVLTEIESEKGSLYLTSQINYLSCDLNSMDVFEPLAKYHPTHRFHWQLYSGIINNPKHEKILKINKGC